jgi:hypothetical protein
LNAINLIIQLDRALWVVLGTGMGSLEHVPRRIGIGFTLVMEVSYSERMGVGLLAKSAL